MRIRTLFALLSLLFYTQLLSSQSFALVIHGGAGSIQREDLGPARDSLYRKALQEALATGYAILDSGGSALDAVESVIVYMENSPLFNAGRGAILNSEGIAELDASIMNGRDMNAGAVASVRSIKNPIKAARLAMERSSYVLMVADGAEHFAKDQGLEIVEPEYFITPARREWYKKVKMKDERGAGRIMLSHPAFGTVGCVALDSRGNLAAGTSTGGRGLKRYRRVGDSPIIGAGTYAENGVCALSATGYGEYYIRGVLAYDVAARMKYGGLSLQDAMHEVIHQRLQDMGGTGGLIGVDSEGNVSMDFNTNGMFRAYRKKDGQAVVKIYGDE